MRITNNTIQEVKAVSVKDIIGQYITLKKHGSEYRGLCPFHDERTPSFYLHPLKGYKCFGCNAKGSDAISFVMDFEKKTFPEAVAFIAALSGIKIDKEEESYRTQQQVIKIKATAPMKDLVSFIPIAVFKESLTGYETNDFVKYLIDLFGSEITGKLVSRYFIGCTLHRFTNSQFWPYISKARGTIFWQIDKDGKIRTGKIILFDPTTGKRVKEPFSHINWVHSILKLQDFELKQCFFGEHLLTAEPCKPVAIVESEKTAIIASVYLPQFIWLACGSLTNLNHLKCKALTGRNITLFPDKGGFDEWTKKANELKDIVKFRVSDLLEIRNAEPKSDLADYLIKFNYKEFVFAEPQPEPLRIISNPKPANFQPLLKVKQLEFAKQIDYFSKPDFPTPISWEQDITELEQYFESIALPNQIVNYKQGETIGNVSLFLETHFATIKTNKGKQTFLPFLNRLKELKKSLE